MKLYIGNLGKKIAIRFFRVVMLLSILVSALGLPKSTLAEGSANLYPTASANRRGLTEWRVTTSAGIYRRTFFRVYALAGEYILMGSSAMGIGTADIVLYTPGQIANSQISPAVLNATPKTFTCSTTGGGATTGSNLGILRGATSAATRTLELIGPTNGSNGGYTPCIYQAPATGTYWVGMYGPDGTGATVDGDGGTIDAPNITVAQHSGVSVWDITVRSGDPVSGTNKPGRVYVDYLAQITGGNGPAYQVYSPLYAVTLDGYVYRVDMNGLDPYGYIFYGNRVGYLDPDGVTPLYHDVVYPDNTLSGANAGVLLAPATAKLFFSNPLSSTDLPASILPTPITPSISNMVYKGSAGNINGYQTIGGTFTYTGNIGGISEIIISRDGIDFAGDNANNRLLLSQSVIGTNQITWDGKDNNGVPFPVGNGYKYRVIFHAGEYHFPLIDAENSPNGGPELTLLNPVNGICPFNVNCHTAFYDDRGYKVSTGAIVGTVGATLPGDANSVNPPAINHADTQTNGFDTSTNQRAWGNGTNSGFGNWKALDLWAYFPVSVPDGSLNVIASPSADLNILKSHTGLFSLGTNGGSFTISVSNVGTSSISGTTTVSDTLPAGLTLNATPSGTGWACSGTAGASSFSCNRADTLAVAASFPPITVNVDVAVAAAPTATNTATVSNPNDTNPGNDSSSDLVTINTPSLGLAKTDGVTAVNVGGTTTYSLTVSNTGVAGTSGAITLIDVLPSGLSVADGALTLGGTNSAAWSCTAASNVITCTSGTVIAASASSVFSFTANVAANASGTLLNKAQVGGGGDPSAGTPTSTTAANCSGADTPTKGCATDSDTVNIPSLGLAKTDGVTAVNVGGTTTYSLTVSNTGGAGTSGTLTVVDVLPSGLSVTNGALTLGGANSADWTCTAATNLITCISSTVIAASGSSVFSFTANVAANASGTLLNKAQVGGGGDPLAGTPTSTTAGNCTGTDAPTKGCATDSDTVNVPSLGLAKTDGVTTVPVGGSTTYSLTVSNTGAAGTSGTITVVDVLPAGLSVPDGALTLGGANSADWSCTATSNVITCTSLTTIAASASSVFSFTANVAANASGTLLNKAQVGGGGDPLAGTPTSTTAGNCSGTDTPTKGCATDTDTVNLPSLGLAKTDGVTSVTAGGTTTYSLTVSNTGAAGTSGTLTIVDVLPSGLSVTDGALTLGGANSADWTCTAASNVITCSSITAIAASGSSVFSFTANVAANASGTLLNKAQVGGGGDPLAGTPTSTTAGNCSGTDTPTKGCATDSDTIVSPSLGLAKTDGVTSVTTGGTTTYSLTVSNTGTAGTTGTITVVDVLPSGLSVTDGALTLGGANSADWTCTAASNIITCPSSTTIAAGGSSVFSFTASVAANASGTLLNKAQVGGGGDPLAGTPTSTTAGNCSGTDTPTKGCATDSDTTVSPSLGLVKTDGVTTVTAGGTTTYSLTVTNKGIVVTSGMITVVDVLPSGLSVTDGALTLGGANSADWSCIAASNVITCTSSTVIATSGSSVFSFTASVAANASGTLLNKAQVGGGGDPLAGTPTSTTAGNCSGTDTPTKGCATDNDTTVSPSLGLAKTDGVTSVTAGGTTTYSLTVSNKGTVLTSGTITVVDVLPNGMTVTDGALTLGGANSADWSCTAASNVITCTSTTAIATSGSSVFSFIANIAANAAGTLLNKAQVGGGGDPSAGTPTSTTAGNCTDTDAPTKGCATDSDLVTGPRIGLAKQALTPVKVSTGVYVITYDFLVKNYGPVALTGLQVTDDLSATFPTPATFTIQSLTSSDLTVNSAGFTGTPPTNGTNMLAGTDTLPVGAIRHITLVVRVTPSSVATYNNTATATGTYGTLQVSDVSQDGVNPDKNGNGDPTDDNQPTPVTFTASIFDPPHGIKSFDASGLPVLKWTVIWINETNIPSLSVEMSDPIAVGTAYNSALGVTCTPAVGAVGTTTSNCSYESPTPTYPRGRIVWVGTLGPDLGHLDETTAKNYISITYSVTVTSGISSVQNIAELSADWNNNQNFTDPGESNVAAASSTWGTTSPTGTHAGGAKSVKKLPATGFAPGIVSSNPAQPEAKNYQGYSSLSIEIPSLNLRANIVGVPLSNDNWDTTWLGNQVGYLGGTAFPTWLGNSVITGHVYGYNGLPGLFVNLGKLSWGSQIVIHSFGQKYIYAVRSVRTVLPDDLSVLDHKAESWVTLLTCKEYDPVSGTYKLRTAVQAVLVQVLPEAGN